MGIADVFGKDATVEVKINDLLRYFESYSQGKAEAELLKNGIKAGVPVGYLAGVVTGEPVPVKIELPEAKVGECCGDACDLNLFEEPEEEILFMEEINVFITAIEGNYFGLTQYGYECSPDHTKAEREPGKPVKGFETRVPVSWVEKGYVKEMCNGEELLK